MGSSTIDAIERFYYQNHIQKLQNNQYIALVLDINEQLSKMLIHIMRVGSIQNSDIPIVVKTDPKYTFRACVKRIDDGFLILIGKGFLDYSLAFSAILTYYAEKLHQNKLDCSDINSAKNLINDCILNAIEEKPTVLPESIMTHMQSEWALVFQQSINSFTLAHEVAHVINNDLNRKSSDFFSLKEAYLNYNKEITADLFAFNCLAHFTKEKRPEAYIGAILLFYITECIIQKQGKLHPHLPPLFVYTHPPALLRIANALMDLFPDFDINNIDKEFVSVYNFVKLIEEIVPDDVVIKTEISNVSIKDRRKLDSYIKKKNILALLELAKGMMDSQRKKSNIYAISYLDELASFIKKDFYDARGTIAFLIQKRLGYDFTFYYYSESLLVLSIPLLDSFYGKHEKYAKKATDFIEFSNKLITNLDDLIACYSRSYVNVKHLQTFNKS